MHRKKLVFLDLSAEDLAKLDQGLALIEEVCSRSFISLSGKEIRRLAKKGCKSEFFCRQAILVLGQNREFVPPGFDIPQLERDWATLAQLAPRRLRMQELLACATHTEIALGSDVLSAALDGYALLKRFSPGESLDLLREAMAQRNPGRRRPPAAEA